MPIYTKKGDKGKTALFGGKHVWKYDNQVEAYGATDEATSFIGLAHEALTDQKDKELLSSIQLDLYTIMAYLSDAQLKREELEKRIVQMEKTIDQLEEKLPNLVRFVLPQGGETTVRLHIARSVTRTAERRIVEFCENKEETSDDDLLVIQYMNRLSDLFFTLSRKYSSTERLT